MKKIKLTQGKYALVSDIDYKYLNQWKWRYHKSKLNGYAKRTTPQQSFYMHRVILERMGFHIFKETDHRDGNGLNNQRRNLRPSTRSQNCHNLRGHRDNPSGYKGVCWFPRDRKWQVRIYISGHHVHLGYFNNKIDAARVYNKAAKKYFGEFAYLNKI